MTDGTVIHLSARLRDGREVKSKEDMQQWHYEYFDRISSDFGQDMVPAEVFPPMLRVMIEWVEGHQRLGDKDLDRENAQALADGMSESLGVLEPPASDIGPLIRTIPGRTERNNASR